MGMVALVFSVQLERSHGQTHFQIRVECRFDPVAKGQVERCERLYGPVKTLWPWQPINANTDWGAGPLSRCAEWNNAIEGGGKPVKPLDGFRGWRLVTSMAATFGTKATSLAFGATAGARTHHGK